MAARRRDPRRDAGLLQGKIRSRASAPPSSIRPPSASSARADGVPTFKGYRGFPGSICASPNAMVVHGIPGPYRLEERGHHLDRRRCDARRLGGRRGAHLPVGEIDASRAEPAERPSSRCYAGVAECVAGQSHGRHVERDPAGGRGRGAVGRALARRTRRRAQHARGPAGAQLRQARQGAAAGGGHGAGDRADDDRRAPGGARGGDGWAIFSQDGSPPRTSSSRSRSPATGRLDPHAHGTCRRVWPSAG